MAKMELYNNLRKTADVGSDDNTRLYPAGFVHLPKVDAEYVQQLCAESLITRHDRNGFAHREWLKMRERNEALDIFVYARAAACNAGLDRFEERHWRELEKQLGLSPPDPAQAPPTPVPMTMPQRMPDASQNSDVPAGINPSGQPKFSRRVIRSPWLKR